MKSRFVDVVGSCVVTIAGSSVTAIEVVKVEPCFVDFVISSVVVVDDKVASGVVIIGSNRNVVESSVDVLG